MVKSSRLLVDIAPVVDCRGEVIDHLHHSHGVLAEVETLLRVFIDVPLKQLLLILLAFFHHHALLLFRLEQLEVELEEAAALATELAPINFLLVSILVVSQLHDLKVV